MLQSTGLVFEADLAPPEIWTLNGQGYGSHDWIPPPQKKKILLFWIVFSSHYIMYFIKTKFLDFIYNFHVNVHTAPICYDVCF